jgi:hypothetical protein
VHTQMVAGAASAYRRRVLARWPPGLASDGA